jgi:uncharacterized membrane protein YraQ (UPF0718 family)
VRSMTMSSSCTSAAAVGVGWPACSCGVVPLVHALQYTRRPHH